MSRKREREGWKEEEEEDDGGVGGGGGGDLEAGGGGGRDGVTDRESSTMRRSMDPWYW